ncbi:uncharacterized protein [Danio rerio]|uniref:Myb/SANT-like DNA-binding domain-containing protein n=1 Tax=Danio rerio TaxID=7955 RepID=A0A8M3ARW7_DANRE|nr:uncharacterized protein LOC101883270 [Danio rerio]XP_017211235.1 uncharacterized protein LOC101883270 [Danio rerio]|eukprot:XP_009299053.1 uncharacterized protein LOC101883270 [Danio rerio]
MENVFITLTDRQGTLSLTVSKEIAEKIKQDHKYAACLMQQVRSATLKEDSSHHPASLAPCPPLATSHCTVSLTKCPPPPVITPSVTIHNPTPLSQCPPPKITPGPAFVKCSGKTKTIDLTKAPQGPNLQIHLKQTDCDKIQEFTHRTTLLLLDLTQANMQLYYKNKIAFYKKIEQDFKVNGYNMTNEKLRKKLGNMITTYKRAKDRCRATGEEKITWEYYKQMEELFGKCGVGSAPPGTICSITLFKTSVTTAPQSLIPASSSEEHLPPNQPGPSTAFPFKERPQKRVGSFYMMFMRHMQREEPLH